jgi:hypothetical protein
MASRRKLTPPFFRTLTTDYRAPENGSKDLKIILRSNAYELGFLKKDWVPIADFALLCSPCGE